MLLFCQYFFFSSKLIVLTVEYTYFQNLLKLDALSGRTGACSQPMSRAKETLSRVAVTRASSEKYSDFCLPTSDFSKEQRKSCDICRRFETMLNPILVCSGCKVIGLSTGPFSCTCLSDLCLVLTFFSCRLQCTWIAIVV